MRRRPFSLVALALAVALAVTASAALAGPTVTGKDGNTQSIDVIVTPKKLSKTRLTPGALKVVTDTTSVTNPNGVPSPAIHVVFDFDKNTRLYTKGLATCNSAKIQSVSTEEAERICAKAKIGSGKATALLPLGQLYTVNQVVTAFNGKPQGGKPTVILHTYGTTPLQVSLVLVGTVTQRNKEGYGPRLDLNIPKISGGIGALTHFEVKISKKWRFKGHKRTFISSKCTGSKKLKARADFTYLDGEHLIAFDKRPCKQSR